MSKGFKWNREQAEKRISVAFGRELPDLVFTNCKVFNVFTDETEEADVAVSDGVIAGIGSYVSDELPSERIVDLGGATICPGLIDGHIHIESSMLTPVEFARAVLAHGTTAVITDPHEIANVAGIQGIRYMMEQSKNLFMDIFFVLPSCVPATPMDESGAVLLANDLKELMDYDNVVGFAEMMNAFGTVRNDRDILDKIEVANEAGKIVDGHAPGLSGKELNAYIAAGVASDHECCTADEAIEKLRLGQYIMVREGTAARNLESLLPLFDTAYYNRCLLVTDDKHPGDLLEKGHIDYIIRKAIALGADPAHAIHMATYNAASYFGLRGKGAVAPGYFADLIVVDNIHDFNILKTYYKGQLVSENGSLTEKAADSLNNRSIDPDRFDRVFNSFHLPELKPGDFEIPNSGAKRRVIGLVPGEIITEEIIVDTDPSSDAANDIVKLAVIERHKSTGHIGLGYMKGYGLKAGAVASSVAHDSHNLIVTGTNDADMALAANTVRNAGGGLAIVKDGVVLGELALPVGGLMTTEGAACAEKILSGLKQKASELGVPDCIDPFMTLAFSSLPVIPALKLTTQGLFDVRIMNYVPVSAEDLN